MVGGANPAKHTRSKKKETVVTEEDNENEATVQTETEPPGDNPPSDGTNKPETYEDSDAEDGDDEEDEQEKPVKFGRKTTEKKPQTLNKKMRKTPKMRTENENMRKEIKE
ncbi:hypothetical protein DAPPUDRAFT_115857 [Daphnia pulex]|uniref:Uncharacterized protein n=1 Tax=Daphnia pulex TaxID=6669 RepID=E9HMS9_DAPPU|nr:hypothetical protein DAPPUDRAFT_115857 [Daphnia pulex]|eukprot:EFX66960.1 hypothetical protein DAPPUDRAFT_115857 [Daphnia pulex]